MKRAVLCLTVLLLCVLLTACGGKDDTAGLYQGQYVKTGGREDHRAVFSLELNADGTGTQHRDGLEIEVAWTREGKSISLTETYRGMELSYTGTLSDGTLELYSGDPDDPWTRVYVYEKE